LKPKFTPEANNMKLFGPGVMDVTRANSEKAIKVSGGMKSRWLPLSCSFVRPNARIYAPALLVAWN
jgi:hypothetical protein